MKKNLFFLYRMTYACSFEIPHARASCALLSNVCHIHSSTCASVCRFIMKRRMEEEKKAKGEVSAVSFLSFVLSFRLPAVRSLWSITTGYA